MSDFVAIPAGRFLMGSESGRPDERPVRSVEVAGFRIGRTPVTRAQYAPFVAARQAPAPPWWDVPGFASGDQPVVGITWFEAAAFAAWSGERLRASGRLPGEAEWEWAMRGGLEQAPTAWGESLPAGEVPAGPLAGPWSVGRGQPNGFGVLDPGTVVHEWCRDWYAAPAGEQPGRRASRGGSWRHHVRWSPPAARSSLPPDFRYADYGFRVLLEG